MGAGDWDLRVRTAAFERLAGLVEEHGEVLPRDALMAGVQVDGQPVPLVNAAQGIHKPRVLDLPLSITTAPPRHDRPPPYADELDARGLLRYRYRGTDPSHRDNVGLRELARVGRPLVYFHGVVAGQYLAAWPVYVVEDRPSELAVLVDVDAGEAADPDVIAAAEVRPGYRAATRLARVHQAAFRERVIRAYQSACAMCQLRRAELLDAAHLIPDSDPRSRPEVPNGLALCKLHHAAFDACLVGVRPDHVIEVRDDILAEIDGPMLVHGLQGLAGAQLRLPRARRDHPNTEWLTERYEQFRAAG